MHSSKGVELWSNSNHFFCNLYCIAILCVQSCNKRVSIAIFNHAHTKVIAFIHLVVCFIKCVSLTSALFCKMFCKCCAAALFLICTHVNDFYTAEVQFQASCKTSKSIWI